MGFIDRRLFIHMNWGLLALAFILFSIGVVNLYSASGVRLEEGVSVSAYYQKQLIWGGLGFLCMLLCMIFDYRHLQTLSYPFFLIAVVLLIAVPLFGVKIYGAKRWLDLGLLNFQPSEIAKIAVLIMGARELALDSDLLNWKRLIYIMRIGLIPAVFIILQPDLGTGLTLIVLVCGMVLYHGIQPRIWKFFLLTVPFILPLVGWLAWDFLHDYQQRRILTFLDPTVDPKGAGYHIIQSQIAIGSGNLWGKGFFEGTQSLLRFLPEKHTDFAVAVFGEEWGFVGCVVLLSLFCLFLLSMLNTVRDAKDRFGSTLVAGIFFYFFWQMLVNMGMVMGLMPVVGIPLPFISYGGSGTLTNFILIGLALNVSMRRFIFKM